MSTIAALSSGSIPLRPNMMISVATHYDSSWAWDIEIPTSCNCNIKRESSMIGIRSDYGKSMAEVDAACNAYRECHECAIDQCIGEWTIDDLAEDIVCHDSEDTCKGAVCHCNREFSKAQGEKFYFWNNNVHHHRCRGLQLSIMFWSTETPTIISQQTIFKNMGIFRCIFPMLENLGTVFDDEKDPTDFSKVNL